jgi:transposase
MAYRISITTEVLAHVHQGMTVLEVSQMYSLSRNTVKNWLKHPDKFLNETRTGLKPFDIEEKVDVLRLIEKGDLTHRQIADLKQINLHTIRNWIKDKGRILAVYSSQGHLPKTNVLPSSPGEETESVSAANDKDTRQHIRDLKDENEFLKAKVAYLEALMELNGTPASGFKKKSSIRPSIKSSEEASET